jgi:hypothetical protein
METTMKMLRYFFSWKKKSLVSILLTKVKTFTKSNVKEKHPFIDIHEEISCNHLADVFKEDKRKVDQQPTSTIQSPVLATYIQPYVSNCKEKKVFCYQPSKFYHLFSDPIEEYMELHFLHVLKPSIFFIPSTLGGNMKNVINLLSQILLSLVDQWSE